MQQLFVLVEKEIDCGILFYMSKYMDVSMLFKATFYLNVNIMNR